MSLLDIKIKKIYNDGNSNEIWYRVWEGYWSTCYDVVTGEPYPCFLRDKIKYEGILMRDEVPEDVIEQTELIKDVLIEENNLHENDFV